MEPRSLASMESVSEKINDVTANFKELISGVLSQAVSEKLNGNFPLGKPEQRHFSHLWEIII